MRSMKHVLLCGVSAVALCLSVSTAVWASDSTEYVEANPWSGTYIGTHLGYGWAQTDGIFKESQTSNVQLDRSSGLVFGLHAGINWQSGRYVYGVEADVSFPPHFDQQNEESGNDGTGQIISSIETLASVRARLGVVFDHTLVYATGGLAYVDSKFDVHDSDENATFNLDGLGGEIGRAHV